MTTEELALALKSFKITPAEAQLNPNRNLPPNMHRRTLSPRASTSIAAGRVLIEYNGKSKVIAPSLKSAVSIRRLLIKFVDPSFTLIKNKGVARKAMEALIQCIDDEGAKSLAAANVAALQNKVSKAEQKARNRQEIEFIRQSKLDLQNVLNKYARVFDESVIMEAWKEAVVREVLEK